MTRSLNLAMRRHSIQPRTRKYVEEFGFSLFTRKYKKTIIGYRTKCCKTCFPEE